MALFSFSKSASLEPSYLTRSDAAESLEKYLIPGEILKWSASSRVPLTIQIRPLLPYIIIFLAVYLVMASLFIFGGSTSRSSRPDTAPPPVVNEPQDNSSQDQHNAGPTPLIVALLLPIFFSGFFCVWCFIMYNTVARHFSNPFHATHSSYGLTQYRILWLNGDQRVKVHSYTINIIRNIQLEELGDGVGNIMVSLKPSVAEIYNPFNPPSIRVPQLILKFIPDALRVFKLISEAQIAFMKGDSKVDV